MNDGMKLYYDYTVSPLGKLFYKTIWSQLEDIKGKRILDFGSGFGFTANFLAKNNEVVAIEKDEAMIESNLNSENYVQLYGDLSILKDFEDESFEVVICHLVLEFVDNPKTILSELIRVLKKGGIMSIVKHNKNGRIIQAIVQDYDIIDAKKLLLGGNSFSSAFGDIKYYECAELFDWTQGSAKIISYYGARVLASLHSVETQNDDNWVEKMFDVESELLKDDAYIKIAYFNHLLLKRI